MGTGMDVIYPAAHAGLSKEIQKCGAIMTEYHTKLRADKENFPRRNRVIAALADVVVVVQSAKKGGSLITADFGNQYFKDVFAYPGRIGDEMSEGCNALIKQHQAHLIQSVDDIRYIMRWEQHEEVDHQARQTELFMTLDPDEQMVVDLLRADEEGVNIDSLHHASSRPLSKLSSILLNLEFKGVIKALPGKKYALI
jgi:Predicted Rossmann fold nucleotide-binding protein involved in DNA uptake